MIQKTKMLILFLLWVNCLQAEQIWLVKFPSRENYLSHIQVSFPFIDLLQHDHEQSSYVFLIPQSYLSEFTHFIHQSNGFYRVLMDDVLRTLKKSQIRSKRSIPSDNPIDPSYSQRFLSYDEQQQWYSLLRTSPVTKKHVRLHNIGQTHENRSLTVVQIHSNTHRGHRRKQRKLAVFIDGGMHAREWLSVGVANFVLIQLLALKEKNHKVEEILRHFDVYILPLMNPDGYEYSRTENRLWRKNRSPTGQLDYWNGDQPCYGIDLNRNFPYQWNTSYGASSNPCTNSYGGASPTSENEVRSVVDFLRRTTLTRPKFHVYFNLHAYGRFWLLPWTYSTSEKVPNYDDLLQRSNRAVSRAMNQTYRVGQASLLLYPCSGSSLDFAATLMPHAITFELSPLFKGLPLCFNRNGTAGHSCTVGFNTGPESIEKDGTEVFNAIVEYLFSIVQDRFV